MVAPSHMWLLSTWDVTGQSHQIASSSSLSGVCLESNGKGGNNDDNDFVIYHLAFSSTFTPSFILGVHLLEFGESSNFAPMTLQLSDLHNGSEMLISKSNNSRMPCCIYNWKGKRNVKQSTPNKTITILAMKNKAV